MHSTDERREVAATLRDAKRKCDGRGYPWMTDDLILAIGYEHDYEADNGIFDRLYNRRMMIRLVGVRFSELVSGMPQLALFDDNAELTQLYATLDKIKLRFGEQIIHRASS